MSEQNFDLYRDIAKRTDGDVYIGVVGPVRTGKSTLISRMMEELVLSRMAAGPGGSGSPTSCPRVAAARPS